MRRGGRPARQVSGAKIGSVELGAGNLGDAVDTTGAANGWIPVLSSGQRLMRGKTDRLGGAETRQAERNAAGRDPFHELTA
jgi:hypothetical protein